MDKNTLKAAMLQSISEDPNAFIEVLSEAVLPVLIQKYPIMKYAFDNCQEEYNQYIANLEDSAKRAVEMLQITLPNASVNKPYSFEMTFQNVPIKDIQLTGLEETGLSIERDEDGVRFTIGGVPTTPGTFEATLSFKYAEIPIDREPIERKIPLIINPDPRSLWKDIETDPSIHYFKADTQKEYLTVLANDMGPQKDIVAASKRGRSHAHEGKARDDHFQIAHLDNGWYIMAVADGAGSARYSREGSRIACETVVNVCSKALANPEAFETHIRNWHETETTTETNTVIGHDVYGILATAAYKAHQAIKAECMARKAEEPEVLLKHYATTLLLTICKKFDFGWCIASFWVGDGAICLYDKTNNSAKILGQPDEGEFAGQTRFLTMPEIFTNSTELMGRLRYTLADDFTALFLMSDGVSDPKFETDANLARVEKWDELWEDLVHNEEHPVDLSDDNEEAAQQLLDWLDFWSPGNHDDRTIAILY